MPPIHCAPGTFNADDGNEPCTPAPPGTFVAIEGALSPTDCPPGRYQDEAGQTSCDIAQPGTFVAVTGATSATLCAVGSFQPNSGAVSCVPAPIGTYVDVAGAVAATDCPPGTTTNSTGATSASDCVTPPNLEILGIAYMNFDGADGYDESGSDVLIAKITDTVDDEVVSVGDTVTTNQYPTDFDAATLGNFTSTTHVIDHVEYLSPQQIMVDSGGHRFWLTVQTNYEIYREWPIANQGQDTEFRDQRNTTSGFDAMEVRSTTASAPDTPVSWSTLNRGSDDPFIDVDLFV